MFDRARIAAAAALAAVALAACSGSNPRGDVTPGPGGPDAVPLVAVELAFQPERLELPAGERVRIEVRNRGAAAHDFTVEPLGLSTGPIEPGGVATATLEVPPGETPFVCSLHPGMEGVIVGT
jgi:plastocyanin